MLGINLKYLAIVKLFPISVNTDYSVMDAHYVTLLYT